jgi:hypothetical protein
VAPAAARRWWIADVVTTTDAPVPPKSRTSFGSALLAGLVLSWISFVIILGAAAVGDEYLIHCRDAGGGRKLLDLFTRWDGRSYVAIADEGYLYDKGRPERIAFFPLYPLLGRLAARISHSQSQICLLLISNLAFASSLVLLYRYCQGRTSGDDGSASLWTLLVAAYFPPGFFFRMVYTESVCLFLFICTLSAIRKQSHPFWVAALAGIASGCRSVGVAASLPLLAYIWSGKRKFRKAATATLLFLPLSYSGLLGFSAFQLIAYKKPFAFIEIQDSYRMRPRVSPTVRAIKLATAEPIWACFDPRSDGFWSSLSMSRDNPEAVVSLMFWNPIYFVAAALIILIGAATRSLDRYEILLASGLLIIPYVTRGYDFGMCSQARFVTLCFPIYIVAGRIMAQLPDVLRIPIVVIAAINMAAFTALFSAGYPLF